MDVDITKVCLVCFSDKESKKDLEGKKKGCISKEGFVHDYISEVPSTRKTTAVSHRNLPKQLSVS